MSIDHPDYAIEVESVSHLFQSNNTTTETAVLTNVDLKIPRGEFIAFVGPSGCGKTTLLNIIAGLIVPSQGVVRVNGAPIKGPQSKTGYMFARAALLPWRTAQENIELPLELRFNDRASSRLHARSLLKLTGLEGFEKSYPRQLSQGMQQRVSLARTLAYDPTLLLLDEPFAALDAQTKLLIQREFIRIWEQQKQTVIFVTHDLKEAVALADRVIVFSRRPGRFKIDLDIDLTRPRDLISVGQTNKFNQLYEILWDALQTEFIK